MHLFNDCEGFDNASVQSHTADEEPPLQKEERDAPEKSCDQWIGQPFKVIKIVEESQEQGEYGEKEQDDSLLDHSYPRTEISAQETSDDGTYSIADMQQSYIVIRLQCLG